jgi:hypothetical protein
MVPTSLSAQPIRSRMAHWRKTSPSEDILEILRMILAGASLKEVLTSVARVVESHREGMLCSVWLLDSSQIRQPLRSDMHEILRAMGKNPSESSFPRTPFLDSRD